MCTHTLRERGESVCVCVCVYVLAMFIYNVLLLLLIFFQLLNRLTDDYIAYTDSPLIVEIITELLSKYTPMINNNWIYCLKSDCVTLRTLHISSSYLHFTHLTPSSTLYGVYCFYFSCVRYRPLPSDYLLVYGPSPSPVSYSQLTYLRLKF